MELTLVVMAAGIGSRYGGLKQMDPFGPSGEFILDYSVYDAIRAGFDHVVFIIRREMEGDFRAAMGARMERRVRVTYVYQELADVPAGFIVPPDRRKPWGTGHAVLAAAPAIRGPFAVINADDYYGRESFDVLARRMMESREPADGYEMVGFILRNTVSEHGTVARGVCTEADGWLTSIVERTKIEAGPAGIRYQELDGTWVPLTGDEMVSMNMWGFRPSFMAALREGFATFLAEQGQNPKAEYFVPTVVNQLIAAGTVRVALLKTPCQWFGVTHPPDKPAVMAAIRRLVDAGVYPVDVWRSTV